MNTRPWRPEVAAKNQARSIASLVKRGMMLAADVDALIEVPATTIEHAERIGLRRLRGGGRMASGVPCGRHPIRESAISGRYILRNCLLPGRKSMVPYSIHWLMRLKPARSRHDLLTLFDLLQHKKMKPLSHNGCLSAKRGTHTNYWEAEA